mgnify:CR=1 FL=1
MSLSILWEHIRKIWEKGRGYKLSEILEETNERKKAIFIKGETKAFVLATSKQVSVTLMRKSIEEAKTLECQEIMIATLNKVTPQANQLARKKGVEIIDKNAPLIYIFDHWMVPEHRVLSKKEAKEIIEKYAGGNPNLLPKILVTDPAVRILKDLPPIVGIDGKIYGEFKVEDIVTLPKPNAEVLIKQGVAQRINTR